VEMMDFHALQTPDQLPIAGWWRGPTADLHGLFVLTGFGGQGLMLSPGLGAAI